jgi:glycosyltransferase involved in cell wall biosynthesis
MKDLLQDRLIRYPVLPIIKLIEKRTFSYASNINLISGGFKDYFQKYDHASFTFFTNGIDDEFLELKLPVSKINTRPIILYAGNIGEGQGLHKFVPPLAKKLENKFDFIVIGDGGAKQKLIESIAELGCRNIDLKDPVSRTKLKEYYAKADYFLMHLNDFEAFKKVLPSKIFELAAMDKPIIAGVGGFAGRFVEEHVSNSILVNPCDFETCANKLESYTYKRETRFDFVKKYRRDNINTRMAESIKSVIL